jgi:uncharacterized protein (TIGR00369 family)
MSSFDRTRRVTWQDPAITARDSRVRSGLERLQSLLAGESPKPPMAVLVGIEMTECERGRVVFTGTPAEFHYNLGGVAHGGFACTLLDSALGCAVTSLLPAGRSCTTVDLHVRFIRPLTQETGAVRCEARVLHLGKTIGTAEARITDSGGRLCAYASTACAILDEKG